MLITLEFNPTIVTDEQFWQNLKAIEGTEVVSIGGGCPHLPKPYILYSVAHLAGFNALCSVVFNYCEKDSEQGVSIRVGKYNENLFNC